MALWTGLGMATVAQLLGVDVGRLISRIMQAALMARQNRKECEQLARRVFMIAELLPHVQEPGALRLGLGFTLLDAQDLVESCCRERCGVPVMEKYEARMHAERFREVQSAIDFYLIRFPVISHIGVTRRLDLVQVDSTRVKPSPLPRSSSQLQEVAQEVLAHGIQEFTTAEIMAATNNFALDSVAGGYGKVYRGTLHDGREVAVKRFSNKQALSLEDYRRELDILSPLQHEHIIRLLGFGWCVTEEYEKKEPDMEMMVVYEYMENGSLSQHLHPDQGSSSLSPVMVSWKVRIEVLLGVSRAIEHLHCHANPPIIHRNIKSANILLDVGWEPRLSDFGLSVHMANEESGFETHVIGTMGYMDPEYARLGRMKLSSDLYGLGVVMLEVLTGQEAMLVSYEENTDDAIPTSLPSWALPIIEAGTLGELLDRRPIPEPTPGQLRALEQVAQMAARCVQMASMHRPAISDIVANLEMALELICRYEPSAGSQSSW